jgi:hypothetical protein
VNAPMMQVNNEWVYEVRNRLIFRITYQFNFRI